MNGKHSCVHLLAALSEYISGEVAAALCTEIETHMAECENCRIVVDTLKKTITLYQAATPIELPEDVRRRLYQTLNLNDYLVE